MLKHARQHPSTICFSDNIRQLDALAEAAVIAKDDALRLQEVYRRYRRELHHRTLDGADKRVSQADFIDERRSVRDIWQTVFGD